MTADPPAVRLRNRSDSSEVKDYASSVRPTHYGPIASSFRLIGIGRSSFVFRIPKACRNIMTTQLTLLKQAPEATLMKAIHNALAPGPSLLDWFLRCYRGNKPFGGLWTSAHTPDSADFRCDWEMAIAKNAAVHLGCQGPANGQAWWILEPDPDARILQITSLRDAASFTKDYHLETVLIPKTLRDAPMGPLITGQITDWEKAFKAYDAIHLSADAADQIAHRIEDYDTAFHTWNCESTLWGRWKFKRVEPL
jgi:hypothetical protein